MNTDRIPCDDEQQELTGYFMQPGKHSSIRALNNKITGAFNSNQNRLNRNLIKLERLYKRKIVNKRIYNKIFIKN